MGLFDKIKNNVQSTASAPAADKTPKSVSFTFSALPENLEQLKALPEASLDTPYKAAALTVLALCVYVADQNAGLEILDYLRGPRPLSPYDKSFLKDRLMDKNNLFVPFSYFNGAVPQNDYTPSEPFTLVVSSNTYSFRDEQDAHYATLILTSGGADSPRQVTLRQKGNQWLLWEQQLFVGIRKAKSLDEWA